MRDINLILENIVFMELLRRGYTVTVGKSAEKEVDFVCEKKDQKIYIQVTYLLASEIRLPGNLVFMILSMTISRSMSYRWMNLI